MYISFFLKVVLERFKFEGVSQCVFWEGKPRTVLGAVAPPFVVKNWTSDLDLEQLSDASFNSEHPSPRHFSFHTKYILASLPKRDITT